MSTQTQAQAAAAVAPPEARPAPPAPGAAAPPAAPVAEAAPKAVAAAGAVPPVTEGGSTVVTTVPGRVPKPVIVAAAIAGVVLIAVPLALSGFDDGTDPGTGGPSVAGYAQEPGSGSGFVPGVADRQDDRQTPSGSAQPPGTTGESGTAQGDPAGVPGETGNTAPAGGEQAARPGQPNPAGQPGAANNPAPPAQAQKAAPTYEATAGPGCGGSTKFTGVGAYSKGKEGWVDHGSGCGTAFVSIPMSGDAGKDDASAHGLWTFNTGPVTAGSCTVSVFVPNGDVQEVGGSPTSYRVFNRFEVAKGGQVGAFDVKQVDRRGQWVEVGTFRIDGAKLAVQLLTRGQDWSGSTRTYAHHAAAAVKARCQA